jgi:hypothetical protein
VAAKFRAGVVLCAGRQVGESGLGAEPGDGFLDALLEGDFGRAEDRIGFVHGCYVVGNHTAVAGGSDIERLAGEGGDEIAGEPRGAKDGRVELFRGGGGRLCVTSRFFRFP